MKEFKNNFIFTAFHQPQNTMDPTYLYLAVMPIDPYFTGDISIPIFLTRLTA